MHTPLIESKYSRPLELGIKIKKIVLRYTSCPNAAANTIYGQKSMSLLLTPEHYYTKHQLHPMNHIFWSQKQTGLNPDRLAPLFCHILVWDPMKHYRYGIWHTRPVTMYPFYNAACSKPQQMVMVLYWTLSAKQEYFCLCFWQCRYSVFLYSTDIKQLIQQNCDRE